MQSVVMPPEDGLRRSEQSRGELLDTTAALHWEIERLEAKLVEQVADIEDRRSYERDGAATVVGWLRDHCRMGPARANQVVRLARAGRAHPELRQAHLDGRVNGCELRRIAQGSDVLRRDLERRGKGDAEIERDLAGLRRSLLESAEQGAGPEILRRDVESHRHKLAADSVAVDEWAAFQQRELYFHTTFDGMVDVRGTLDPVSAATVCAAIDPLTRPAGGAEERTAGRRRADALIQLAEKALGGGSLPGSRRKRPHVNVTVGESTLRADSDAEGLAPAELHGQGPGSGETARMLACDGEVTRVVHGPRSEVLDVGRTTRVVPPALYRALVFRDGGCAHPGCDRPVEWCDAHHLVHWAQGGQTALDNLVLLCRRHHTQAHLGGTGPEKFDGGGASAGVREGRDPPETG